MKVYHPDIAAVEMGLNHFNDTLMAHFWRVKNHIRLTVNVTTW
jgi:hypothetical protein